MPRLVARISEAFNNLQCLVFSSRVAMKCRDSLCLMRCPRCWTQESFPASVPGCVPQLCPNSTLGHDQSMHRPFPFSAAPRSQSTQAGWEPQIAPADLMHVPQDLLGHALLGNLDTTTVAPREGDREWIFNTIPKGRALKYELHAGVPT